MPLTPSKHAWRWGARLGLGALAGLAAANAHADMALVDAKMKAAQEAEKIKDCEVAYEAYQEAETLLASEPATPEKAQAEARIATKLQNLKECYEGCKATDIIKGRIAAAKSAHAAGETKRAVEIMKNLLRGKNTACRTWREAKAVLSTMASAEALDAIDPCEAAPEINEKLEAAHAQADAWAAELADIKKKGAAYQTSHVEKMQALGSALDDLRLVIFELREQYLNCDSVYGELKEKSSSLKSAKSEIEGLITTQYKKRIAILNQKLNQALAKLKKAEKEIAEKDAKIGELSKRLDETTKVMEDLFDDLLMVSGLESGQAQGENLAQEFQNLEAVLKSQERTLAAAKQKFPEFFQDKVNTEGLKRRKFVLEKMEKMLGRFEGTDLAKTVGYNGVLKELRGTVAIVNATIGTAETAQGSETPATAAEQDEGSGDAWVAIILILLVAGGLAAMIIVKRQKPPLPPEV